MPVPRRFDRRPPERDTTRTNDRIRVPEVRLVGEDGKQIGVIKTSEALAYAQERDLDLVEVAPDARPPVCRVLDYSKYKYEQAQKQKAARKHQQQITIREIKFRPKIAQNDYDTKKGHVKRFLLGRDRVKVTIMFRGREVTHPERGTALLEKLAGELSELAIVEQTPLQDGRNMTMMLAPSKAVLAGEKDDKPSAEAEAPAAKGGRNGRHNGSDESSAPKDTGEAEASEATEATEATAAEAGESSEPAAANDAADSAAPAADDAAESAAPASSDAADTAAPASSDATA
ncbi:MAG TPA: translation initiation factor IF-3 [Solirubrobacteraceae bacterium]|nr:translation initiation factor IF-3 [Solirubrobacteraceae bacterium]